jgi:nicotinamide riboside kinase
VVVFGLQLMNIFTAYYSLGIYLLQLLDLLSGKKHIAMIKIIFTGPECSGKTTLSTSVSKETNTNLVKEYARDYLSKINRPYEFSDLLQIAKGQRKLTQQASVYKQKFLVCDTDLEVIKIWSLVKYGKCDSWILNNQDKEAYYFLCHPEVPWKDDPFRENRNNRLDLFELYKQELFENKRKFKILKGNQKERFNTAYTTITKIFSQNLL